MAKRQTIKQREALLRASLQSRRDRLEADIRARYPTAIAEPFIEYTRAKAWRIADSMYEGRSDNLQGLFGGKPDA